MNQARTTNSYVLGFLSRKCVCYTVALTLAMVPIGASADTLFKCKDADGQTHFQDRACAKAEQVSSRELIVMKVVPRKAEVAKPRMLAQVTIPVGQGGAYWVGGVINRTPVTLLVDTGASGVGIPMEIADQLGVSCEQDSFVSTANGIAKACYGNIRSLKIGNITLENVKGTILAGGTSILLGQTALSRLKVEQNNGKLILTER